MDGWEGLGIPTWNGNLCACGAIIRASRSDANNMTTVPEEIFLEINLGKRPGKRDFLNRHPGQPYLKRVCSLKLIRAGAVSIHIEFKDKYSFGKQRNLQANRWRRWIVSQSFANSVRWKVLLYWQKCYRTTQKSHWTTEKSYYIYRNTEKVATALLKTATALFYYFGSFTLALL